MHYTRRCHLEVSSRSQLVTPPHWRLVISAAARPPSSSPWSSRSRPRLRLAPQDFGVGRGRIGDMSHLSKDQLLEALAYSGISPAAGATKEDLLVLYRHQFPDISQSVDGQMVFSDDEEIQLGPGKKKQASSRSSRSSRKSTGAPGTPDRGRGGALVSVIIIPPVQGGVLNMPEIRNSACFVGHG